MTHMILPSYIHNEVSNDIYIYYYRTHIYKLCILRMYICTHLDLNIYNAESYGHLTRDTRT